MFSFSKIGEDQSPEDAEDGPPELLVMYRIHTNFEGHKFCCFRGQMVIDKIFILKISLAKLFGFR